MHTSIWVMIVLPVVLWSLVSHEKIIHEKLKSPPCQFCGKTFSNQSSLTVHTNTIHNGIKNFKCESCDNSFTTSSNLKSHTKYVHHQGKNDLKC